MNWKKNQQTPYYAVIFTSLRAGNDNEYEKMAQTMEQLASKQKGFLGIESVRENKFGITISYWESLEDIDNWKKNSSHREAQKMGKKEWYKQYNVRVCKVERDYYYHM